MSWNIHEVEVGMAIGAVGGIAIGYELHRLVLRFRAWRGRRAYKGARLKTSDGKVRQIESVRDNVVEFRERPPVIPIKRSRRSTPKTPRETPVNPDRDDVIAALMSAGYPKAAATKAVDACSLAERASGLEAWTRCAFNHAMRKS